jgi:hypothetical protein
MQTKIPICRHDRGGRYQRFHPSETPDGPDIDVASFVGMIRACFTKNISTLRLATMTSCLTDFELFFDSFLLHRCMNCVHCWHVRKRCRTLSFQNWLTS